MPKKILIATGLYPPEIGGPATYVQMLEEELPAHDIATVVVPFGSVRHLPKIIRHIVYVCKLAVKARSCDVVYALDPVSVGLPALLVSKLFRKPFLIRLGGDYAWEQGSERFGIEGTLDEFTRGEVTRPVMVRIFASIQTFVVKRAKLVIVPSEYLKSIVVTWGVSDEKISVIYSALFPLPAPDDRATIREQLSYDGTVVISAGRLVPWKGFEGLIQAVSELVDEIPDLSLIIAGEGELRDSLGELARTRGIGDRVRFVGRLSKDALGAAIKAADVFVLNSSYEGLSHQLLEVMDLSTPLVATAVGGNTELIRDGVSGLLIQDGDTEALKSAISRIIKNDTLRAHMIQHARARVLDFKKEKVVKTFVDVLQEKF